MRIHLDRTDAGKLVRFQSTLTNATSHAAISDRLSKFGLSTEALEEGKSLLSATRKAYELSNSSNRKRAVVHKEFLKQKRAVGKLYSKHRKIAKLVLEENPEMYESLGLSEELKTTYAPFIEMVKNFYSQVEADSGLKEQLAIVNVTTEELDAAIAAIPALEKVWADYMIEKGASQHTTDAKNNAFAKMDDWMSQFFHLSKVALWNQPQLMETFGVVVKN